MKKNHDNFKVGRIMIVDDEAGLMTTLCEALAGQGYETTGFTTGADALKVLAEQNYDLLLTDLMMPEMDGIALLQAGLEIDPNLVGIIMTGHGTVQTAVEAIKLGAFDYVLKPFKLNTLLPLLSRAMEVRSLRMENIQLRETVAIHELGKVIAFSSDLNAILNKVADATLQQCNADEVSIMLPTRDGKELYVAVSRGGHREYIGERVPMERGIAGWVASHRETVIINGTVDDPRFSPVHPRTDIRAAVSMPMMAGGNLVGVLNVNVTKSHRHMTLGQVKALSILVSIISPILENTWLNIQIRQAEEKYRSIFENATEGIYQITPEGQFITANTAMAAMLGYDSPEALIATGTDIAGKLYVNPEERTKLIQLIAECGQVKKFETRFYRKDGHTIWVSINIRAICDKKGEILNYDAIAEDITERKQAENILRATHERLLRFVDANIIGVVIFSPSGGIIEANDYYLRTIGYTREEFKQGMVDWRAITPPEWLPADEQAIEELRNRGICTPYEKEYVRRDGTRVSVFLSNALLPGAEEQIAAFVLDITERKRAEEAILRLNEQLEQKVDERTTELQDSQLALLNLVDDLNASTKDVDLANQKLTATNKELEAFSYSVSHDLRAPLRGMDGFSQVLLEDYSDKLDATGKNYLERIRTGTQHMGLLIDDMLKLSRINRTEFKNESVDLSKMIQAIILTVGQNNPARDVQVSIQKDIVIQGDRHLLEIALTNLVENAWKFTSKTENARIEFGTELKEGKPVMFIRDNGVGFDMAYVDKLFGAFQRLHTTAEFPGTGIGLATVQRVIHRHGGRIWAEGNMGKGASFFFTLP